MSGTLVASRTNVRKLMRDLPYGGDNLVPDELIDDALDTHYKEIGAILGFADTWTLSAIALVAGQEEYSLPTAEYQSIAMLRRTEDGTILRKTSMLGLESNYQSTTKRSGDPVDYAIYEDASGVAKVRLYPLPDMKNSQHLDMFTAATELSLSAPADVIYLSRIGLKVLEAFAAAECLAGVDGDRLKERGISGGLAQVLQARGQMMLDTEKERRSQFRRQDAPRRVRF